MRQTESTLATFAGDLIVRRAEERDLDAVYALETQNSLRPYSYNVTAEILKSAKVFVAACGEKLAGYAAVSIVFEDAELINIVVDKNDRGRGIGKMLLATAIEESRKQKAKRMLLEVEETNLAALTLYQRFGFKQIFIRENYYGENSAIIMEYHIN